MDRDPLLLSARDYDDIIAYHRRLRASYESGGKAKPDKATVSLDLAELGLIPKKEPIKRRL